MLVWTDRYSVIKDVIKGTVIPPNDKWLIYEDNIEVDPLRMKTYKYETYLSNIIINVCDSRRIGQIKIVNPYRIRVRRIAP